MDPLLTFYSSMVDKPYSVWLLVFLVHSSLTESADDLFSWFPQLVRAIILAIKLPSY